METYILNKNICPTIQKEVVLIGAVGRDRVVGFNGKMPWSLPEDLRHFRRITWGHTIIMGRRTFKSIGKALDGRQNIILSESKWRLVSGIQIATSLDEALKEATMPSPVFVIGGEQPWAEALQIASKVYLTEIDAQFDGDVYFPMLNNQIWQEAKREECVPSGDMPFKFSFVEYLRAD